jgi:hypothetical protein
MRHWRSYGIEPLPSRAEALDQPFIAFPSWFLRIECDRCGKVVMINEAHFGNRHARLHAILDRMRHDGCGGRAAKAEPADRDIGRVQPPGAPDRADGRPADERAQ